MAANHANSSRVSIGGRPSVSSLFQVSLLRSVELETSQSMARHLPLTNRRGKSFWKELNLVAHYSKWRDRSGPADPAVGVARHCAEGCYDE